MNTFFEKFGLAGTICIVFILYAFVSRCTEETANEYRIQHCDILEQVGALKVLAYECENYLK